MADFEMSIPVVVKAPLVGDRRRELRRDGRDLVVVDLVELAERHVGDRADRDRRADRERTAVGR